MQNSIWVNFRHLFLSYSRGFHHFQTFPRIWFWTNWRYVVGRFLSSSLYFLKSRGCKLLTYLLCSVIIPKVSYFFSCKKDKIHGYSIDISWRIMMFCKQHWKLVTTLQVNEYPCGVGLSPHIDTHSAFEGFIFSLSLAGPCIMEFRRYTEGSWIPKITSTNDMEVENPNSCSELSRKAIYLPPRSMLLLSGEARYAWHHYIPHHKVWFTIKWLPNTSIHASFCLRCS